ncbi:WAP four-disulfide core domain protein 3-like, partial [Sinocyclocheilus anshuiensis]|uniref:WAP four-disulfide core domain protein 3-like n=1 Tax=Sinocyclocheilus anshuiensis TaxID=1608454 RepID=UPI0007B878E4
NSARFPAESIGRPQGERITARVCCALVALLLCLSVCLSRTPVEGPDIEGPIRLVTELPTKPKVCPRNNLEVAVLGVCVESCSHDSDCPNDEKCCHNGCGHQCMAPYKESAKPGVCPINNLEVAVLRVCVQSCSHDSDCPNDEKCCSNGCGHQCMPPYAEKPGVCPSENLGEGLCVEMCSHDSNCPNDQKCCSNGCGHQCMPPYREKPGVCPRRVLGVGLCAELCAHDIDCPKDEKCCSTICGRECTPPYKVRPGLCLRPMC